MVWLKSGLVLLFAVSLAAQWGNCVVDPRGDFLLHQEFGRRLRMGEFLYGGGLHVPYPPSWAVPHVPLSLLSPHVAQPAFFVLGILAAVILGFTLLELTKRDYPLARGMLFWTVAGTLCVTYRFWKRDFDDGGQNLVLLTLVWLGIWLFLRGRSQLAAASLGLAVALKCTAGLMLAFFLLKRQWGLAARSLLWTGLFLLTPALWQGPRAYLHHMNVWGHSLMHGLSQTDPSVGILGPERMQNKSLRPVLARYLMRLPAGHPGRYDDARGYVDVFDLAPETAGLIVKGVLLLLAVGAGWLLWGPGGTENERVFVWEAACVSVLMLLFSPITWGQHCVAAIPAVYVLIRAAVAGQVPRRVAGCVMVLLGAGSFLGSRALLGLHASYVYESYHPITFSLLILALLMLATKPAQATSRLGQQPISRTGPEAFQQASRAA